MSTQALRTSPAIAIHVVALSMAGVARALASAAVRVDTWLATRARSAQARRDLLGMSDRELRDIGLERGQIDDAANGWSG